MGYFSTRHDLYGHIIPVNILVNQIQYVKLPTYRPSSRSYKLIRKRRDMHDHIQILIDWLIAEYSLWSYQAYVGTEKYTDIIKKYEELSEILPNAITYDEIDFHDCGDVESHWNSKGLQFLKFRHQLSFRNYLLIPQRVRDDLLKRGEE